MTEIMIVGAGIAGMSAAITCASEGAHVKLISNNISERAQSVMAEGGINAALDVMGEGDTVKEHYDDTMRGGCDIADADAVSELTVHAPEVVRWLDGLGVPFEKACGHIMQRNFGGQKKKRTAYVKTGTGKAIVTALSDEMRRLENEGYIERLTPYEFMGIIVADGICAGVRVRHLRTGELKALYGPVIICSGGLSGLFPTYTTGSTLNNADVAASLLTTGVIFSDLEMIQYHPTTVPIAAKRLLISEAARGEGGRLCIKRDGSYYYFMEDRYPTLGNLMPRDVVSREMTAVSREYDGADILLDMTGIESSIWKGRLSDLREELIHYLSTDPVNEPVCVKPGIHYFMGGIDCDSMHHTSIGRLYAAGECTSIYHGANRLGGNSLLGAAFGGRKAAATALSETDRYRMTDTVNENMTGHDEHDTNVIHSVSAHFARTLGDILYEGMGIVRNAGTLGECLERLNALDNSTDGNLVREKEHILLAKAMVKSAMYRRESRGAHYREDCPDTDSTQAGMTYCAVRNGAIRVDYEKACIEI